MPFRFSTSGNSLVIANTSVTPEREKDWFLDSFDYKDDDINQTITIFSRGKNIKANGFYQFLDEQGNVQILDSTDTPFADFASWKQFLRDNAGFSLALGSRATGYGVYGRAGANIVILQGAIGAIDFNTVVEEGQLPFDVPTYYDSTAVPPRIQPGFEDDLLQVKLNVRMSNSIALGEGNFFIDQSVAGDGSLRIEQQMIAFSVTAASSNFFIYNTTFQVTGSFLANGGRIYFNSTRGDTTISGGSPVLTVFRQKRAL